MGQAKKKCKPLNGTEVVFFLTKNMCVGRIMSNNVQKFMHVGLHIQIDWKNSRCTCTFCTVQGSAKVFDATVFLMKNSCLFYVNWNEL